MSRRRRRMRSLLALTLLVLAAPAAAEVLPEDGSITSHLEPGGAATATSQAERSFGSEAPGAAVEQPSDQAQQQKHGHAFDKEVLEAARAHSLPQDFFKRLIWRESRFRPNAISRAGAQ